MVLLAGRGPAPKDASSRRRRNKDEAPTVVPDAGGVHGRPLPEGVLPGGDSWHPQTVALWEALRRSPLLENEPELGWQFLIDTALMHHAMWSKGRWESAQEVRLRVGKFGATPEDRQRLKIQIETPVTARATGTDGTVTDIAARRARLSEG